VEAGRERIELLVRLGKLREKTAQDLIAALEYTDRRAALPPPDFLTRVLLSLDVRAPDGERVRAALFLAARIDRREYLRRAFGESARLAGTALVGILAILGAIKLFESRRYPDPTGDLLRVLLVSGSCVFLALSLSFSSWMSLRGLIRLRRLVESVDEIRQP
jgi:hypothetical protein